MVDDLSALSLRELIALARQRLGPGAGALKTRAEFVAALSAQPGEAAAPAPPAPAPAAAEPPRPSARPPVVTRDFFAARRA